VPELLIGYARVSTDAHGEWLQQATLAVIRAVREPVVAEA